MPVDRERGVRFEFLRMRPRDHMGWVYAGASEFAALAALLKARRSAGLSQAEIARRMGVKSSSLARIETSLGDHKHSPSIDTLRRYAIACGKKLIIKIA